MHEVTIIGAGPAGMTAAVYAARKKLKTLLVSKDIGGQAIWASKITIWATTVTLIAAADGVGQPSSPSTARSLRSSAGHACPKLCSQLCR